MATKFVERHSGQPDQTSVDDAPYVIRDRRVRLLGVCGLHAQLGARRLEIGYWVDVRHTRRGVATLACAALTKPALTIPELTAVKIHHDQATLTSAAISVKLGYEHIANLPRHFGGTRRDRHRVAMAHEPGRLAEQPRALSFWPLRE